MKKKISRILGVGLSAMLLASLMVVVSPAAPAAASGELSFGSEMLPNYVLAHEYTMEAITVYDIAVSGDVIYAVTKETSEHMLLKSTDGGSTWEDLTETTDFPKSSSVGIDLVAVSPDDANVVVIVTEGEIPYYSSDGGASWITLGRPATSAVVNDIAVSGLTGGYTYVAAGGTDGSDAELYTMKLAMAQSWEAQAGQTNSSGNFTADQDVIKAIALSPNFTIDKIIAVVSGNDTASAYSANFQCFRYEEGAYTWNGGISYFESWRTSDYENGISLGTFSGGSNAASIAFYSDYDGTDSGERIAFVGLAPASTLSGSSTAHGVYRLTDTYAKAVTTWSAGPLGAVNSLAYHESGKLLIGSYASNTVYSCLTPMVSSPMCEKINSLKQPGGTDKTLVAWSGDTVIAVTQGDESCFSVSDDDAYSFVDISLINTGISTVTDVAVSADGGTIYAASYDGDDVSIWLKVGASYQRVLSMKDVASGVEDFAIRIAPDDPEVVYINSRDKQDMWMSRDSGKNKWKSVPCYKLTGVQDFVVESSDVLYAISTTGLSKSTNGGSSWSVEKSFEGKTGYMITLAPNNDVLVGCKEYILFSTDGGSSFSSTSDLGTGDVKLAADSNYADNSYVYYNVGTSTSVSRRPLAGGAPKTIGIALPDGTGLTDSHKIYDLAVAGDVLYVLTNNSTDSRLYRALEPRTAIDKQTALWGYVESSYEYGLSGYLPQPIKIAPDYVERGVGPMYKLWMVESASSVSYFEDALATYGITPKAPADEEQVPVNALTGRAYDLSFSWERFSSAYITTCQLQIATDPDFNALLVSGETNLANGLVEGISTDLISKIVGPYGAVSSEFMPGQTYYWRVRVSYIDTGYTTRGFGPLLSPWSAVRSFTVESEIAFAVVGPEVGATGVSITPTLSWSEYPGATSYEIQVADGSIPEGITFTILDRSRTSELTFFYIDEALKYSNTYYWRVRAVTDAGYSDWVTGSFTTEAEPVEAKPTVITITEPAPPPEIEQITITEEVPVIPDYLLWTIVGIGAVLVIALIILIVRTRRVT